MLIRPHSRRRFTFLIVAALLALTSWTSALAGGAGQVLRLKPAALSSATGTAKNQRVSRPASLRRRIEAILRRGEARRGFWGIEVVRLSDGKTLYSRFSDELFHPASNMKLFTTAAAIERLGPEFVFRTTVESEAAPDAQGRVGKLILVGRGDPNLSGRVVPYEYDSEWQEPADAVFQQLAEQVAGAGVREVTGNLVLDDSYFLFEPYSHGWTHEDLQWGYAAPVTALAFNDNALRLRIQPGVKVGDAARVWIEPVADYYQLNDRVETTAARTSKQVYVERACGSRQLDVWGQIPVGAETTEDSVAVDNPLELIGDLLRSALEVRGVTVHGSVEVRQLTRVEAATGQERPNRTAPRVVLAEHVSLPLREVIKVINKASQNLHAEMLLRTLGREVKNYGSLTVGLEVLRESAAELGIAEEVDFADGSGLSRQTLVSPHAVAALLTHMAHSPRSKPFLDSLPVAGVDGTLAERFRGTSAAGHIFAKTGTIEHVNALSGYMNLPSGERLAFSIIGNSHPLSSSEAVRIVDGIALTIFEAYSPRPRGRN